MKFRPQDKGFLGLGPDEAVPPEEARAVVIPFGLEASVSYGGGTAAGPEALIAASHEVELFDEHLWKEPVHDFGVATLAPVTPKRDIREALDQLEAIVAEVLAAGKFPLVIGGEHSLTAGAIRPFAAAHEELAILHFDAHADLRDGYEGESYSHAAALRRVLDFPQVKSLVSIGIRNISKGEIPYLEAERERIHIHWARDRKSYDLHTMIDLLGNRPVYLTFDLDGFDVSLMPATGTPEPGGLFWDDVVAVIEECGLRRNIVGADIVELAPIRGFHGPDFTAAKLAYKILTAALVH